MTKTILLCAILMGFQTLADEPDVTTQDINKELEQAQQKSTDDAMRLLTPDQQNQLRDMASKVEQNMNSGGNDSRF